MASPFLELDVGERVVKVNIPSAVVTLDELVLIIDGYRTIHVDVDHHYHSYDDCVDMIHHV